MNKSVLLATVVLLAGCSCTGGVCDKKEPETSAKAPVSQTAAPVAVPCSHSCVQPGKCQVQEPVVLKPRVTETVKKENKRPCCADDDSWLKDEEEQTYVPVAPEIYVISANRTINSMQTEAEPLFKQVGKIKVYVAEATPKSEDLPGGMEKGTEIIKKRLAQMDNITVVGYKSVADFIIDSGADWYDTPTKTVPAIKYDIHLKDRGGNLVDEWSEIIHQAEGDRSWW